MLDAIRGLAAFVIAGLFTTVSLGHIHIPAHPQTTPNKANAGAIAHAGGVSADMGCGLGSAQTGENVGYWSGGVNDAQLNTMFMNSSGHRANIMGPYRYVGTAWKVAANGAAYIAVEFG